MQILRIIEMSPRIPITLVGDNLGKRHQYLNTAVSETLRLGEPINDVLELSEKSTVDRLFKIDLAVKQKNVQYILKNMKDADMLYVNRALKAKWLLEEQYKDIINPVKLESDVYPEMILPAVNKMRHWIHLNLRDEIRCQEFYLYYSVNNHKLAIKYLLKSPADFIIKEIPFFFNDDSTYCDTAPRHYMTPHYFKMFCEKNPLVAKLVYDKIDQNNYFRLSYRYQQDEYFKSMKCVLKVEPDIYLDIVENHCTKNQFTKLSAGATKFVMTHKKDRYSQKPELYAAWLLDVKELARCLNGKECEDLVIQLARSKFLDPWFNYKNVEPLIKRVDKEKRVDFIERIFVRKEVGEEIKNWPYSPPDPTIENYVYDSDSDGGISEYLGAYYEQELKCLVTSSNCERRKIKTRLSGLFDEYRFKSFSETLLELRKKISAESSPHNRMRMMLVLVSKSGGKEANLEAIFEFLMRHRNEPPEMRAAIIRSMVRRASIWRVSDEIWENLLKFGENLGLDGGTPKTECWEGLHAVVIRSLIKTGGLTPEIKVEYLNNFNTLIAGYTLSKTEKTQVLQILPNLLLDSINAEANGETAATIMEHLLDTLEVTEDLENAYDNVIPAVKKLLERDQTAGKLILKRLFESHIGRKDLFKENFDMIQLDASYVNALKHDTGVLTVDKLLKAVSQNVDLDRFFQKTSIYFAEDGGLASRLLDAMKKAKPHKNLARPIAFLIGANIRTYISKMDVKKVACKHDKDIEMFCAEIRANAHLARPEFNLDSLTWHRAGVKLVANKVLICKSVDLDRYILQSLLWKRSARLATVLADRSYRNIEILKYVATIRPTIAIKIALKYFKRDQSTLIIWETIKPLISKLDPETDYFYLKQKLEEYTQVPESIRPEFIQFMFPSYMTRQYVYNLALQQIFELLPRMEPQFVDNLLLTYFKVEFDPDTEEGISQYSIQNKIEGDLYVRILAKYLLLCKNENEQTERFACLGDLFFNALDIHWQNNTDKQTYLHYINTFIKALHSNSAYFSCEYVSCLPMMMKVLKRMEIRLHVEVYFNLYIEVHLLMLYYTSVQHCIKLTPKIFAGEANDLKNNKEFMKFVVEVFGKYVARDAKYLILKYFDSVLEIFSKVLKKYFNRFRESRYALSLPFVKGLVEGSEGFEGRLAVDMYDEYRQDSEDWHKVRMLMKEKFDKNMMFFYNDIIANPTTRPKC